MYSFSDADIFCVQIRWDQAKPASVANLILLKFKEVIQLYSFYEFLEIMLKNVFLCSATQSVFLSFLLFIYLKSFTFLTNNVHRLKVTIYQCLLAIFPIKLIYYLFAVSNFKIWGEICLFHFI